MTAITKRRHVLAAAAILCGFGLSTPALAQSDAQIKQKIINALIASYSGNCPCPYNTKSNGHRCGGNSAHSRAGGKSPKCFDSDISAADVKAWRRSK
jgi:hypothetical protein